MIISLLVLANLPKAGTSRFVGTEGSRAVVWDVGYPTISRGRRHT